jgi:hypothetical protein
MVKNTGAIIGYGGDSTAVWVAPVGTTTPTGLAAPAATFKEIGWISDGGIGMDWGEDVTEFRAHQGNTIVKRKVTGVNQTFTFQALEANAAVLGVALKGLAGVAGGTGAAAYVTYTLTGGNQTRSDPRMWVIDEYGDANTTALTTDPLIQDRWIIPSGIATLSGGRTYVTTELTVWEFTIGVQGGNLIHITNAPAVVTPA